MLELRLLNNDDIFWVEDWLNKEYVIDYLIGEETCIGKGLGKEMIPIKAET